MTVDACRFPGFWGHPPLQAGAAEPVIAISRWFAHRPCFGRITGWVETAWRSVNPAELASDIVP